MPENRETPTKRDNVATPRDQANPQTHVHPLSDDELQRISGGRNSKEEAKKADIGG